MDYSKVFFEVGSSGYYIYELNAAGFEADATAAAARDAIQREVDDGAKGYTDVFIIAHGYMTGRRIDGSIDLVNRIVNSLEGERPPAARPLYIAVKWPSLLTTAIHPPGGGPGPGGGRPSEPARTARAVGAVGGATDASGGRDESDGDWSPLDDERRSRGAGTPFAAGALRALEAPFRGLYAAQDALFGRFARRASRVGARGVHALLAGLMAGGGGGGGGGGACARFHLVGHSLGAHVACAAAIGGARARALPRRVHALALLQGAVGARALARGGAYRPLAGALRPVAGPIVATVFRGDMALGLYDAFHAAPAGKLGLCDVAPLPVVEFAIADAHADAPRRPPLELQAGTVYNVESSAVIASHLDCYDPAIGHLIWSAAQAHVPEEDYAPTDPDSLPAGYWEQYKVRTEGDDDSCTLV